MSWSKVGDFLKENAADGLGLVGSLLTGNIPGAIATGVSLVSSVTGTDDPTKALNMLVTDPNIRVQLAKLANKEEQDIRKHIEAMELMKLEDEQRAHEQAQLTIRNGDNAEGNVKWVRPIHATVSLGAALFYVFTVESPSFDILGLLLALPWSYAGLRQIGKWRTKT